MSLPLFKLSRARGFLSAAFVLMSALGAYAWPWKIEPQPALHGREAIWSDADSPLAWDSSWRVLWHLSSGKLTGAFWSGRTLVPRSVDAIVPKAEVGLLADSSVHFLYCADSSGIPHCVRRVSGEWRAEKMGDAPIARLLAVDTRKRAVFAYDAAARGIRLFSYDARKKAWASTVIVGGLGAAEEAGAFNPTLRVLYTTHASADATILRHPNARTVGDPTGIGAWQPWPLVATFWDGRQWIARVLDETGVPQQPAVRTTDHRVFYAHRDEPEKVLYYQRARAGRPESFGRIEGWDGTDTWVDHHHYEIRAPDYPGSWGIYGYSSQSTWTSFPPEVTLQGPITIVPYYDPIWTDTALPARLVRFRAVVNPRSNHLVQHRLRAEGEVVRQQTGQRLAGYLYRDAQGVLAKDGRSSSYWLAGNVPVRGYPALDASFDPANPPAHFSELASADARLVAYKQRTTLQTPPFTFTDVYDPGLYGPQIPPHFSTDPQSPWVAAYLRQPGAIRSRTFGHKYPSTLLPQPGGRYRDFSGGSTTRAAASSLAVDGPSGVSFYTQAPESGTEAEILALPGAFREFSATPLAGFTREWERKLPSTRQSVWIVMVY